MAKKTQIIGGLKLQQYYIQNAETGQKVKVHYSVTDGYRNARTDQYEEAVVIYDKGYGYDLFQLIEGTCLEGLAKNDTDTMTDYFDKTHITIFKDHPEFAALRARVLEINRRRALRYKR